MESCLYRGHVSHRRASPEHRFRYTSSWFYLDLAEIEDLLRRHWLLSSRRFWPASYRRNDHFGDTNGTMLDAVLNKVQEIAGFRPDGPVRLLTQLRHFGVYFSPLNVFYCFDRSGGLTAMVPEVSNTPWNERHCYVLWEGNRVGKSVNRYVHAKSFHVSPFMGMDSEYHWNIPTPGDRLHLSIGCCREGERIFHADMHLRRHPLTSSQLALTLARRPLAALQILGAIYYQAFRLWMKQCPFFPHPQRSAANDLTTSTTLASPRQADPVNPR